MIPVYHTNAVMTPPERLDGNKKFVYLYNPLISLWHFFVLNSDRDVPVHIFNSIFELLSEVTELRLKIAMLLRGVVSFFL